MLCRRELVQAGTMVAAGTLLCGVVPTLDPCEGVAAEASGSESAQPQVQVSVDEYGTQTVGGLRVCVTCTTR